MPRSQFSRLSLCAAAIGELQFGHGRVAQTFFYLLVNAGLGGGLVIDGHSVTGASGRSGEIGFLPIGRARRNPVVLQDVVSLSGLYSYLAQAGFPAPAALDQLDAATSEAASQWVEKAADLLSDPLMVINALIDPDAIARARLIADQRHNSGFISLFLPAHSPN